MLWLIAIILICAVECFMGVSSHISLWGVWEATEYSSFTSPWLQERSTQYVAEHPKA